MSEARQNDYIDAVRNANRDIWEGINTLISLQREWNALDYAGTPGLATPSEGANKDVTKTVIGAVVFDTANAMVALLGEGHATNMAKAL
jgi:hypothetical protein